MVMPHCDIDWWDESMEKRSEIISDFKITNTAESQIPCKKSIYLMIPNRCDIKNLSITQFQYFINNLVISSAQYLV